MSYGKDHCYKIQRDKALARLVAPTNNGIPELDEFCRQHNENEDSDLTWLVCRIWNHQQGIIAEQARLITELDAHEGAEGWSTYLEATLKIWRKQQENEA